MIARQTDFGNLSTYVGIALEAANPGYVRATIDRYLELNPMTARMPLDISPESELDVYESIFHTFEPKLFAAFVTQSADHYSWLNSTGYLEGDELDIVEAVVNDQV